MKEAEELAAMVCAGSPLATQAAVKLYRLAAAVPQALNDYAKYLDKTIAETDDSAEGSRAFKEKRQPVWTLK
jgi:enoyl-CoA hydratase/carnithine racemase